MSYVSKQNIDNIIKGLSNKIAMSVSNGALIGDTTPVGTVISFMGTTAPLYYLICDGTTYNIADYKELADFIEAQFGTVNYFGGDGTTTFAVPDLRGEFLRGTGTNSHTNQGSGDSVGVHQDGTETPYLFSGHYTHDIMAIFSNFERGDATQNEEITGSKFDNVVTSGNYECSADKGNYSSNKWSVDNQPMLYTSRPTNTSVLYCIKYTKAVIPSEYEDGTPIGRVIFDCILREGYIKANGAQIEDASISIPRLLSFIQKYSSQLIAPNQATYDANVGLYMYDSNNDILTLPNYIGRFMEGGNSVASIEAGLPNIKGTYDAVNVGHNSNGAGSNGALSWSSNSSNKSVTESTTANRYLLRNLSINAHNYSSIYSDTVNTVQPSSITLIPQIRY